MTNNQNKNYLNNPDLLEELTQCQDEGVMSDRLGQMFLLLAQKYAQHRYFNQYPYKEDLIGTGVLACCNSFMKFDRNESSNPFAFFSTCVYRAYLQMIKKEYRQKDVKDEILVKNNYDPSFGYEERLKEKEESKKVKDEENAETEEEETLIE